MADPEERSPVDLSTNTPKPNGNGSGNGVGNGNGAPKDNDDERASTVLSTAAVHQETDDDHAQLSTPTELASNGLASNRYRKIRTDQMESCPDESLPAMTIPATPNRRDSPVDSLLSVPDDSPSIQGSGMSSPGSSVLPSVASRPGLNSPTPSLRPFDHRFQSRLSSSGFLSPGSRSSSPAFLANHGRHASISSQLFLDKDDVEAQSPPWEVVRWTKLKKMNGQAFSEVGKRNFGSPTCLAVSTSIVLGTSKGIILMFDYSQNLKTILGPGTKAVESGAITSIAISADHTTVAGGHANGNIFTWDTTRASRPFLHIPHLDPSQQDNRTMDGHVPNVAITHLGFLGTRHTALVSADDRGMAFSHLATRGTGALGRTVRTTRILGRYPNAPPPPGKQMKPSTVLAFGPLPLGNTERATDTMGLTAMLTPYLLVIVSTTPVAQTQHKSARPKDVARHSAMTGCLAWFPAVKLKVPDPSTGSDVSKVKLAYCWSNVLTVLDVDEVPSDNKDKPPDLSFKPRSRWKCDEAIVAVQWLSRSVLTVLTITQRLIVLEDRSMRMTDGIDLIHKHIFHVDVFSKQLHTLVEQLDEEDTSMHGVVADAFYMSFKAFKGRIFLLGFNDVSIGSLSNWADRLIALMENGDYVGAIQLATSYFTGDSDKLTVGLPEDMKQRHSMVRDKLIEIMSASLKYVFGQRQKDGPAAGDDAHLRELAATCFIACQSVSDQDFLFDQVYEWFEDGDADGIFLETLEPYILERTITIVPPAVVKSVVTHYVTKGWPGRLEEMLVHMETATLDLDQVTTLCKQHQLYDALIYVWNQALDDYITPLTDLLSLMLPLMSGDREDQFFNDNATKVFPYLSYTLTGRVYPTGDEIDDDKALNAKAQLYWFLFSGNSITWPKGSDRQFRTRPEQAVEPSFPYLRLILRYDAPSFLSVLNEAFEDAYLNESSGKHAGIVGGDLPEEKIFGLTVDRQYIVSILLEIVGINDDYPPQDTIYLDMFIARNLAKFPQYLLFPGSTLMKVLTGLCRFQDPGLAEDAQLSAEYLLSVYHPPDMSSLMPQFKEAGFYRILKRQYRTDKQYGKLVETHFEDAEDGHELFECLGDCLRPQSGLNRKQLQEVRQVIWNHVRDLIELDPAEAASTLLKESLDLHQHVLDSAKEEPELQFQYLRTLLEPSVDDGKGEPMARPDRELIERYIRLMCTFDPSHVSDYVGVVQSANLRLDALLPTMEDTGVIDAAVVLMAQEGQVKDALDRLVKHLGTLESALKGILDGFDESDDDQTYMQTAAEETLEALQKYVHVGIWLCQGQTKSASQNGNTTQRGQRQSSSVAAAKDQLTPDEALWLTLIEASVRTTRQLSAAIVSVATTRERDTTTEPSDDNYTKQGLDTEKLLTLLRSLVQHTFTALLTTTSSSTSPAKPQGNNNNSSRILSSARNNLSFLRILRAFLSRAAVSSPNLADIRSVLASIFSAYAYEESILRLSNRLLERNLFMNVKQAVELRQRGWRPRGSTCEACGRRVWGPGVSGNVFEAWEEKQAADEEGRKERKALKDGSDRGKGKGVPGGNDGHGAESSLAIRSRSIEGSGNGSGNEHNGDGNGNGKGKGKAVSEELEPQQDQTRGGDAPAAAPENESAPAKPVQPPLGPLVVLACRHIYHQACLDALQARETGASSRPADDLRDVSGSHGREYRCPIDG